MKVNDVLKILRTLPRKAEVVLDYGLTIKEITHIEENNKIFIGMEKVIGTHKFCGGSIMSITPPSNFGGYYVTCNDYVHKLNITLKS